MLVSLASTLRNLVSESLCEFIILALSRAIRLYFKIDRCLSMTQSYRRRYIFLYIGAQYIVLRHECDALSRRTILCRCDRCIQTSFTRHNGEYADNTCRLGRVRNNCRLLSIDASHVVLRIWLHRIRSGIEWSIRRLAGSKLISWLVGHGPKARRILSFSSSVFINT